MSYIAQGLNNYTKTYSNKRTGFSVGYYTVSQVKALYPQGDYQVAAQIGAGALVAAGSVITEPVPADALGLGRARQVNIEGWAADYRRRLHEDDEV